MPCQRATSTVRGALWASLFVLSACEPEPAPPEDVTDQLTELSGCTDFSLRAARADDTLALHFDANPIMDQGSPAPIDGTFYFYFPSASEKLEATRGARLTPESCGGGVREPVVDVRYVAIAGTGTLPFRQRAQGDETPRVDFLLEDLILESGQGERLTVSALQWTDVPFGGFP